ncbi:MAG: DUF1326 domain-containing protein [Nitrososphaerales archaeon]
MSQNKWQYEAEIITPCNCDWGCPCTFNQPPTYGFCQGGWILKVKEGTADGMKLDGLCFGLVASWPGALHFGGGTAKLLVDERASSELRVLIEGILKGKHGGKPWPIFAPTIDKWLETSFLPFRWKWDGAHSEISAGEQLRVALQPMTNPVTGKDVSAKILLPDGLLTDEENVTATKTFSMFADGLKFAWPGRTSWYATVRHGN